MGKLTANEDSSIRSVMIWSATDFCSIVFSENKWKRASSLYLHYAIISGKMEQDKNSFQKSWLVRFTRSVEHHLTTTQRVPAVLRQLWGLKCILNWNIQSTPSLSSGHIFMPVHGRFNFWNIWMKLWQTSQLKAIEKCFPLLLFLYLSHDVVVLTFFSDLAKTPMSNCLR